MRAEVELLKADIRGEMDKISKVYKEFIPLKQQLDRKRDEINNYDKAALGYLIHNFYNGCENIFRSIARFFENDFDSLGKRSYKISIASSRFVKKVLVLSPLPL